MSYSNVRVSHSLSPPLCFASFSSPFSLTSGLLTDYRMAEQTLGKLLFIIPELSLMKCIAVSAARLFCSWGVSCQSFLSWGVGGRAPYVLFNSTQDENYCGANRSTLKTHAGARIQNVVHGHASHISHNPLHNGHFKLFSLYLFIYLFFQKKSNKQCQDEAPKEFLNAEKLSTYHTYNEFKKTFTHLLTAMSFQTCMTFLCRRILF